MAGRWAGGGRQRGGRRETAETLQGPQPRDGGNTDSSAVLLNRGRTTNPVCPVERHCEAFPHCGIVVHIVGLDHKSLLQCLWVELRNVSERYFRNGNSLTAVNKPIEEQMQVTSRPMKALFEVEWYNPACWRHHPWKQRPARGGGYPGDTAYCGRFSSGPGRVRHKRLQLLRLSPDPQCGYGAKLCEAHLGRSLASRLTVFILVMGWRLQRYKGLSPTAAPNLCTKYCGENHHLMAHQEGSAKKWGVHNTQNSHCGSTPLKEHSAARWWLRPVPGHRTGFVTRVCYAENPASHRFGHSGTSAGIWVCGGPRCTSFDKIGFITLICPFYGCVGRTATARRSRRVGGGGGGRVHGRRQRWRHPRRRRGWGRRRRRRSRRWVIDGRWQWWRPPSTWPLEHWNANRVCIQTRRTRAPPGCVSGWPATETVRYVPPRLHAPMYAPTRDETPSATGPLTEREGNKRTKNLAAEAYEMERPSGQTARGCSARCVRAPCYRQLVWSIASRSPTSGQRRSDGFMKRSATESCRLIPMSSASHSPGRLAGLRRHMALAEWRNPGMPGIGWPNDTRGRFQPTSVRQRLSQTLSQTSGRGRAAARRVFWGTWKNTLGWTCARKNDTAHDTWAHRPFLRVTQTFWECWEQCCYWQSSDVVSSSCFLHAQWHRIACHTMHNRCRDDAPGEDCL